MRPLSVVLPPSPRGRGGRGVRSSLHRSATSLFLSLSRSPPHALATRPAPPRTPLQAETVVYVSVADEHRIAAYRMADDGKLTHVADTKVPGQAAALTTDPARKFLFASLREESKLASIRMDPATGRLTHVNTVPAGPDPAQLSTDRSGRYLLTAYYVAAKVTVHALGKDGRLSDKPLQSIATADKAHAIVLAPSNRFVFVPHTGPDVIFQFRFDASKGRLTANSPAKLPTPKGTGPRHLVFHSSRPIAYVANEQGSSVTAYALDPKGGTLRPLETASTLPGDFRKTNACAELRVHPHWLAPESHLSSQP